MLKFLKGVAAGTGIILIWYLLVEKGPIHPLVLPSPFPFFRQLYEEFRRGVLPLSLLYSLLLILSALIPSLLLAFLMAAGAYRFPRIDGICEKAAALAHPLPGITLLPLFILWTGLGRQIVILTVVHSVLWPFYVNLRAGFRDIPSLWLDLGKNRELTGGEVFRKILIPGSFPYLMAGLKVGWARAWRAVIAAEMIYGTLGGSGGLGWYIYHKRIFMDTAGMYGGIFLLMLTGLAADRWVFCRWEGKISSPGGR